MYDEIRSEMLSSGGTIPKDAIPFAEIIIKSLGDYADQLDQLRNDMTDFWKSSDAQRTLIASGAPEQATQMGNGLAGLADRTLMRGKELRELIDKFQSLLNGSPDEAPLAPSGAPATTAAPVTLMRPLKLRMPVPETN